MIAMSLALLEPHSLIAVIVHGNYIIANGTVASREAQPQKEFDGDNLSWLFATYLSRHRIVFARASTSGPLTMLNPKLTYSTRNTYHFGLPSSHNRLA